MEYPNVRRPPVVTVLRPAVRAQRIIDELKEIVMRGRGDFSLIYHFAVEQPSDFYIDARVPIRHKKRIYYLVQQLIPLYRALGISTTGLRGPGKQVSEIC